MNLIRDCSIKKMKTLKLSKDQFSFLFEQLNIENKKAEWTFENKKLIYRQLKLKIINEINNTFSFKP